VCIDEAIDRIRSKALGQAVPGKHGNLWDTMLAQISAWDGFDGEHADALLSLISEFLDGLDDGAIIALWSQTETGMADDPEELIADSVRVELKEELLGEKTRAAWDEAK
jgi:hypothetical protein